MAFLAKVLGSLRKWHFWPRTWEVWEKWPIGQGLEKFGENGFFCQGLEKLGEMTFWPRSWKVLEKMAFWPRSWKAGGKWLFGQGL